jgi:hypothetical protein
VGTEVPEVQRDRKASRRFGEGGKVSDWLPFVAGLVIGICLGMCFIMANGKSHMEIVKAGHAEYYLDENYHRQWRWKEPKP